MYGLITCEAAVWNRWRQFFNHKTWVQTFVSTDGPEQDTESLQLLRPPYLSRFEEQATKDPNADNRRTGCRINSGYYIIIYFLKRLTGKGSRNAGRRRQMNWYRTSNTNDDGSTKGQRRWTRGTDDELRPGETDQARTDNQKGWETIQRQEVTQDKTYYYQGDQRSCPIGNKQLSIFTPDKGELFFLESGLRPGSSYFHNEGGQILIKSSSSKTSWQLVITTFNQ